MATPSELRTQAGQRLTRLRLALGFAELRPFVRAVYGRADVETEFRRVQKYESGAAMPTPDFVATLAHYCGADWNYIYGGREDGLPVRLYDKLRTYDADRRGKNAS